VFLAAGPFFRLKSGFQNTFSFSPFEIVSFEWVKAMMMIFNRMYEAKHSGMLVALF